MFLSRISVNRPVFTTMVVAIFMVLGFLGLSRLPIDLFPQVSLPVVTTIVPYPGASPEQVEQEVVRPIEDAVAGLAGLEEIHSYARENVGIVVLLFSMQADVQDVSNEFRDRVYGLRSSFPDGVDDPMFRRIDPAATPVMTLAVTSDDDPIHVRERAVEVLKPRLEQIDGVGGVIVQGGEEREIRVDLDLPKMAALRIPMMRLIQLVGYDTIDIPGGHLKVGESRVGLRASGQVESLDELGSIVVQGFPQPIYLRDVAQIRDGRADVETVARVNGKRAVTLEVIKEATANTLGVCDSVVEVLEELEAEMPAGTKIVPVLDNSRMVRDMYHEMQRALVIGASMAILVVFLFMVDWRSTFISALALPTSIVTTFFFMWLAGFSLNLLTLMGMVLVVGILIDDAVVVREVIYRHMEEGKEAKQAALDGTKEVALAVLATTGSILAVFIPVGFMGGMVGQFFREFGLTIAIAVAVSLFIAFTVDPMLSARMSKVIHYEERTWLGRKTSDFWSSVDDGYRSLLAWSLRHGVVIVSIATVLFLGSLSLVAITGFEFIPAYDRDQFVVDVRLASSVDIDAAEERADEVENLLFDLPEVEHVYTIIGKDGEIDLLRMRALTSPKNDRERSIFD
ncbi:MAG: efflux RND transporter permease subunit, partial [Proteobacteria bacterium]|nr:efflux RND transporter permease subunit [Pseudomonadota bacterium]